MRVYTGSTSCSDRATRGTSGRCAGTGRSGGKGRIMVNLQENARIFEELERLNAIDVSHGREPHYDFEKAQGNIYLPLNRQVDFAEVLQDNQKYHSEQMLTYEEVFQKTFSESIERFNASQKRKDRWTSVDREYSKFCAQEDTKNASELIHSMIVQVGSKEHGKMQNEQENVQILIEYYNAFIKKFPNLKIVNASIHLDEETPHLQFYYVPLKLKEKHTGEKRWKGIDTQLSLTGALEQMGFFNQTIEKESGEKCFDYSSGATVKYQKAFNGLLDEICLRHNIQLDHYQRDQKELVHQDTIAYKEGQLQKDAQRAKSKKVEAEAQQKEAEDKLKEMRAEFDTQYAQLREQLKTVIKEKEDVERRISTLQDVIKRLKAELTSLARKAENYIQVTIDRFLPKWNGAKSRKEKSEVDDEIQSTVTQYMKYESTHLDEILQQADSLLETDEEELDR